MARWWTPLAGGVALAAAGAAGTAFLSDGSFAVVAGVAGASWVIGAGGSLAANAHAERRAAALARTQAAQRRDEQAVVLPAPHAPLQPRPSWLLLPDNEVVPFRGRMREMEALWTWSIPPVSDGATVMVIKGPAGVGKSRLLVEFARAVASEIVVLRALSPVTAGLVEALLAVGDPAVVVVDLKATQPGLPALLRAAARTGGRVKVAVECRNDSWLHSVRSALDEADTALIDGAQTLAVGPIGGEEDLQRWYSEAVGSTAEVLRGAGCVRGDVLKAVPLARPSSWLESGTSMLVVQAHAVAAVLSATQSRGPMGPQPDDGRPPVLAEIGDYLLMHEGRSWPDPKGLAADDAVKRRALCVLTLLGAQDEADAAAVLARVPDLAERGSERDRRVLARWVRTLYPAEGGREWMSGLEPGLLAHALYAQVLAAQALVEQVLAPGLTTDQLRRVLSTLMPALTSFPSLAPAVRAVLAASPLGGVPEALACALYLEHSREADLLLAEHLDEHRDHVELDALEQMLDGRLPHTQVALLRLRADQCRDSTNRVVLARALGELASGLGRVGRYAEALAIDEETVELCRELAREDPSAHRPGLARALSNFGVRLERVGRFQEGLVVIEEAVGLCRALERDDPAVHRPELARALSSLGVGLRGLGRHAEALAANQQAVELCRALLRDDPVVHRPQLARALTELGFGLERVGRYQEGLAVDEEAVALCRALERDDPAVHRPELARALRNLGSGLERLNRQREALAAKQEAVGLYRELDRDNPAVYRRELARAVNNLGVGLERVGRYGEALAANQEAVGLYRALDRENSAVHRQHLAWALKNLGAELDRTGRYGEALAANQEAVGLYRALDRENPVAHRPFLAWALDGLGVGLDRTGRYGEALAANQEAVALYEALNRDNSVVPRRYFAEALSSLGAKLERAGRYGDALTAYRRASGEYRYLAQQWPELYEGPHADTEADIRRLRAGGWQ